LIELDRAEEARTASTAAVRICRAAIVASRSSHVDFENSELSDSLRCLSESLCMLGCYEDALRAIVEAVAVDRQLSAAQPGLFRRRHADSLHKQAMCLRKLEQNEAAEAAGLNKQR
jgi:hypothetical protein